MGLSDRLKDLKGKAEDAVVERKDQIHQAVEKAGAVADQRTGGKYSERIQKVSERAVGMVDGLKDGEPAAGEHAAAASQGEQAETRAGDEDTPSAS